MPARAASRGFTLIELLVTVAIVGLLSTIALPVSELAVQRTREQELHSALRQIRNAIDAYKQAGDEGRFSTTIGQSGYPPRLQALVDGVDDPHDPEKKKIYFLRRLPRDPFSTDPTLSAADTWGKRSYASSADNPQEGEDVYDVYSTAPGLGLRGTPYREW